MTTFAVLPEVLDNKHCCIRARCRVVASLETEMIDLCIIFLDSDIMIVIVIVMTEDEN